MVLGSVLRSKAQPIFVAQDRSAVDTTQPECLNNYIPSSDTVQVFVTQQ